jgi:hypothetical protein
MLGLTGPRRALGAPPHGPEARRWTLRTAIKPDSCTGAKLDSQLDLCARADFIEDKADKQLTTMLADVAGQIAITATELIGELDSSTRSCCRRFHGREIRASSLYYPGTGHTGDKHGNNSNASDQSARVSPEMVVSVWPSVRCFM